MRAAVHLLSLELSADGPVPTTVREAIERSGAGRSQAYAMLARLRQGLDSLARPAGRPVEPRADDAALSKLSVAVIRFLMEHPGSCSDSDSRAFYHDSFRRFVVDLFAPSGPAVDIPLQQVAEAIHVPLGTLKDWLNGARSGPSSTECATEPPEAESANPAPVLSTTQPQLSTLISEYQSWQGTLSSFCDYARTELSLPFGRGLITTVLTAAGLHTPELRNRPKMAPWSRGTMVKGFPGMQWFGDGKQVKVTFRGQSFLLNLEALVDGGSSATVGAVVTETEDGQAVVEAFRDGLSTTEGQAPLAVTLDNRPSNLTTEVEQALSPTELLRATPKRGQAKAPVEGAFGLFEQALPDSLVVTGETDLEQARAIAELVARAFYVGRNGRPSRRLGGRTPAESYASSQPTEEQVEQAKEWILELRRREELARQSRQRRVDPVRRELLSRELIRLGIEDPKEVLSVALSRYSLDSIISGVSIYESKRRCGTLPPEVDGGRYLGGIIRNRDAQEHLEQMGRKLLELRLSVKEQQLKPLVAKAKEVHASMAEASERVRALVSLALDSDSTLAFRFWTSRSMEAMGQLPESEVVPMCTHVRRMLGASFQVELGRREQLLADLLSAAVPVRS